MFAAVAQATHAASATPSAASGCQPPSANGTPIPAAIATAAGTASRRAIARAEASFQRANGPVATRKRSSTISGTKTALK